MIKEFLTRLNPLETFDKNVFLGNNDYSQDLCNFILSLSLIWNDMKNIRVFYETVIDLKPKENISTDPKEMPKTPFWGEIAGIEVYLEKLFIALIHELFKLIKESQNVVDSICFSSICKQLNKSHRESWFLLKSYAFGKDDKKTALGKALLMVRHKITNHYDKNEIFKGYNNKFISGNDIPYISRGNNIYQERFYFADAAAQEYYRSQQDRMINNDFYENVKIILINIDVSIQSIILTFINRRSGWRKVS